MQQSLEDMQHAEIEMLRERIRMLEELLAPPGFTGPVEWGLTAKEAAIFGYLLTREFATKQQIMNLLYSDRPNDEPEIKIVDVLVCKMRRKLKPFGIEIATIWGQGYGLVERQKYLPAAA